MGPAPQGGSWKERSRTLRSCPTGEEISQVRGETLSRVLEENTAVSVKKQVKWNQSSTVSATALCFLTICSHRVGWELKLRLWTSESERGGAGYMGKNELATWKQPGGTRKSVLKICSHRSLKRPPPKISKN